LPSRRNSDDNNIYKPIPYITLSGAIQLDGFNVAEGSRRRCCAKGRRLDSRRIHLCPAGQLSLPARYNPRSINTWPTSTDLDALLGLLQHDIGRICSLRQTIASQIKAYRTLPSSDLATSKLRSGSAPLISHRRFTKLQLTDRPAVYTLGSSTALSSAGEPLGLMRGRPASYSPQCWR